MLSIYLDQSRFVHLLQARMKPSAARLGALDALAALEDAVTTGAAIVPLSVAHYHETWHLHDWRRRHALAELMRDLSDFSALAPIQVVTLQEVQAAFGGRRGLSVIGRGANYAFASRTGRLVIVDEPGLDALYPSRVEELEGPFVSQLSEIGSDGWEWFNLAGLPEDFPLTMPEGMRFDFRPEHARGDEWAQHETDLRIWVDGRGLGGQLREILIAEDLRSVLHEINAVAVEMNIDPRAIVGLNWDQQCAFHESLPTRSTLVDLTYYRLSERQYKPHQHDRLDLLAHSVAFAYCDIVVTERRLADLARKAKVGARFGTQVIHDLAELPGVIADIRSSTR